MKTNNRWELESHYVKTKLPPETIIIVDFSLLLLYLKFMCPKVTKRPVWPLIYANSIIIEPQQIVNCTSKDYHGTAFTILAIFWYIWGGQFCPCYCFSIFPINMTYCKTFFDISPILLLLSRNQSSGKNTKVTPKLGHLLWMEIIMRRLF